MGIELAAAIIGLTLLGLWVDYHFGIKPVGVIVGVVLGVIGGMYNFIRSAIRLSAAERTGNTAEETRKGDDHKQGR
jgi:F0F1-type ATP synthase assembly protein I